MFLPKDVVFLIAIDYANFVQQLTQYGMLCALEVKGAKIEKSTYVQGFNSLKDAYNAIISHAEVENETDTKIQALFKRIESLLKRRNFTENELLAIAEIVVKFKSEEGTEIYASLFKSLVEKAEKITYGTALRNAVSSLFAPQLNDEIVLNSFKFLDKYLQHLLNLSPYESYGEDLVNRAFSPNTGMLQMNTHLNEQVGLRNFVSGANALFRNSSAHRQLLDSGKATFRGDGDFFAGAVVVLVELIARISTELYAKKIDPKVTDLLVELTKKNNWIPFVVNYATSWSAAPLSKNTAKTFHKNKFQKASDYRINVHIDSDNKEIFLKLITHESVSDTDLKWLAEQLETITNFPVRINE